MHGQSQQQAPSQNAALQQRSSDFYANYDQYNRQPAPQQQPPSGYQQDPYANPPRQLSDPRLYQPPSGHQPPAAPGDRAGPYPDRGGPSDQQYSGGSYGQPPTGRRGPEPSGNAQQSMPNDGQGPEFGMGRRGAGEYGRGQGPNLSRGQTPPLAQGTGAASVLGLGQNKLPQRAEVRMLNHSIDPGAYLLFISACSDPMLCMLLKFVSILRCRVQTLHGKRVQETCLWAPDTADLCHSSVDLWLTNHKVTPSAGLHTSLGCCAVCQSNT